MSVHEVISPSSPLFTKLLFVVMHGVGHAISIKLVVAFICTLHLEKQKKKAVVVWLNLRLDLGLNTGFQPSNGIKYQVIM